MDRSVQRILDANFNRAREALRVLDEYARMILDDAALSLRIKSVRHRLVQHRNHFGGDRLLEDRDTPGDVGTGLSTPAEQTRSSVADVARTAVARATEALRAIEEYGKIISPGLAREIETMRYEVYDIEQRLFVGSPRLARLRRARLHVLLTASLCRGHWSDVAMAALRGGADVIQLREKSPTDRELLQCARGLREWTSNHDALLIINDRPDIALLSDADGVHVGRDDLPIDEARRIVGAQRIVGGSTHGVVEAMEAFAMKPDYLGVGPMFASPTKPDVPAQGPKLLMQMLEAHCLPHLQIPLVAIGGINERNVDELLDRVSDMPVGDADDNRSRPPIAIAVCQAVIAADDPESAARRLRAAVERVATGALT